jgi:hypothetical protein
MANVTAYLVVVLDTEPQPPVALGCAIWSQNDEILGRHRAQATVTQVTAETFEEAKAGVLYLIERWPALAWVKPLLSERDTVQEGDVIMKVADVSSPR